MKFAPLLAVLAFTLTAVAQTRTIDFTQEIKSISGEVINLPATATNSKPEPVTLGDIAVNSLETTMQDDMKLTGEDKFKMDLLAHKIYKKKSALLTAEEIKMIKDRIGKLYGATIVGPAWRMLDEAK